MPKNDQFYCPSCFLTFFPGTPRVERANGKVPTHISNGEKCPGSGKEPSTR